jgi:2-dehydro-3-deoxyglucarate aldolase
MKAKELKKNLKEGKLCLGSWITFTDPSVAELQAKAGFDWLAVDMEHSPITLDIAQDLIRVIALHDVCPLVRVPDNDPIIIKRVLDAGAGGVIVPMVNSKSQSENAVSSVKYPPVGKRSVGISRAQGFGPDFEDYVGRANDETVVIVQIEHKDAVADVDAILSVEGVDAFIVGPYDLSGSMGIPGKLDEPKVQTALKKVADAGKKAGVAAGIHVVYPEPHRVKDRFDEGYSLIAYGVDFIFLGESSREGVRVVREAKK